MAVADHNAVKLLLTVDANTAYSPDLPDVPPGGTFNAECEPLQQAVDIYEIVVRDFTVMDIGGVDIVPAVIEHKGLRMYRFKPPLHVEPGQHLRLQLRNDRDAPLEPKTPVLIKLDRGVPKHFRCKHAVEAMQWLDTDDNREAFATWFERHDQMFETNGPLVVMPEGLGTANEGEWIVYSDEEFLVMEADLFWDTYEAVS